MRSTAGDGIFVYSPHRLMVTTDCWAESLDAGPDVAVDSDAAIEAAVDPEVLKDVAVHLLSRIYAEAALASVGQHHRGDGQGAGGGKG